MSKTISTPKFANGVLVRKRETNKADITNPFYRKFGLRKDHPTYKDDCGRIGTVIKTEIRNQKRKDWIEPRKVFYCEVLWRGREKTEWVIQHRLERVEGI